MSPASKAGSGNQLFCYAAARRLTLVNNAELVIDDITGFARDRQYRRQYALDACHIPVHRQCQLSEWLSRKKPFAERCYLEQEGLDLDAVRATLVLHDRWVTVVPHKQGDENGFADLWLMTQCRHFITANSTFSWWGAWLGSGENKVVLTPNLKSYGKVPSGFKGLIPADWVRV